jgi:hypothetical protein
MAFNKTGGFSGGQPPKPATSTNTVAKEGFARDGFCGGDQLAKSFPGGGGAITVAQLQSLLPQGSTSSVMNQSQTGTPTTTAQPLTTPSNKN